MFTIFKSTPTAGRRVIPAAGFCGIFGVLVQGMTDYVWYNYRVFLMFWLIIGLCCSYRGLDLQEHKDQTEDDIYHASVDLVPTPRGKRHSRND